MPQLQVAAVVVVLARVEFQQVRVLQVLVAPLWLVAAALVVEFLLRLEQAVAEVQFPLVAPLLQAVDGAAEYVWVPLLEPHKQLIQKELRRIFRERRRP